MRIPLVLIGKGGTTPVHGKKQSMATKTLKALRRAESEGRLMICWVNESFTSKVCWLCHKQTNKPKKVPDSFTEGLMSLWGLLECTSCKHNWDMDINAAKNIKYLGLREYDSSYRPQVFSQRMDDSPLPNASPVELLLNLIGESITNNYQGIGDNPEDLMEIDTEITPCQQLGDDLISLNL